LKFAPQFKAYYNFGGLELYENVERKIDGNKKS